MLYQYLQKINKCLYCYKSLDGEADYQLLAHWEAARKKKNKREHFDNLGEGLGLTTFLTTEMKEAYTALYEARYARIMV